mmetsp:Transcript_30064/g.72153  ORF Transcript_30064/g.72153 Transcript_30064/m.72153 type:complete len:186 (-) Transcript_30064:231-788(-)
MYHGSKALRGIVQVLGSPFFWLVFPLFEWQRQKAILTVILVPIFEELACRLMLHYVWGEIQDLVGTIMSGHCYLRQGGKSTTKESKRSTVLDLLDHRYSFRVVSSLIFGAIHIQNSGQWESNVMAAIGAHSAWNLLATCASVNNFIRILSLLALCWALKMTHDSVGDDAMDLLETLIPQSPSRRD